MWNVFSLAFLFARTVQLNGIDDAALTKEFIQQSLLSSKTDKDKTQSLSSDDTGFAVQHDQLLLKNVLNAHGYFQHTISSQVNGQTVVFNIQPGKQFKIRQIRLESCNGSDQICADILPLLKIKPGDPLKFEDLNNEHKRLLDFLQNKGYVKPRYKKPHILLHYDTQEVDIVFRVVPGQRMIFGNLLISGLDRLKLTYIQKKITWHKGATFDKSLVEKFRTKLYETGLFSLISFKNHTHEDTGVVDIEARLTEMPPRYIGVSGYFRTAEGPGGQIEWSHRNLTGYGDELDLKLNLSKYFKHAEVEYSIPHFFTRNQKSYCLVQWEKSNIDAYDSNITSIYPYLKTKFGQHLKLYTGVQYQYGSAKKTIATFDKQAEKLSKNPTHFDVDLISFPVSVEWDTTDNEFAPTKGLFWKTEVEPFMGKEKQYFTQIETAASYLFSFTSLKNDIPPVAWFNKLSVGQLVGKDLDKIVPHQRFYLGGPKDMRSYGLKLVGEVDDDRHPFGGKSYGCYVTEVRLRVKEKITLNLFHEMGIVHKSGIDALFKSKLFHGSGATVCYYSPVLPIQLGFAVPWHRRRNYEGKYIDSPVQFYVGIGQIR